MVLKELGVPLWVHVLQKVISTVIFYTSRNSAFDGQVGRVDAVFLLDCEEETLSKQLLERAKDEKRIDNNVNTIAKRIQAYKEKTLPVLKHYDDMDKLFIVRFPLFQFVFFFCLLHHSHCPDVSVLVDRG